MKKPSEADQQREELHRKIIGLGEKSIRKSYYPELQQKLRELEQEIAERKQHEIRLRHDFNSRIIISDLLKLSLEDMPLETIFSQVLEKILRFDWLNPGTAGAIFLLDEATGRLARKASSGFDGCAGEPCQEIRSGECLCGLAMKTGEAQFAGTIDERHTVTSEEMQPHGHYCLPILLGGKTVGVLNLYLPEGHHHDAREEGYFTSIANTLAGIIQRHRIKQDNQQFERLLLQTQKIEALGTLSGGIAHDFNNLLAPMLGYGELALKDVDPDSRAAKRIREVIKAATRAKDLVKQILTLSHQGLLPETLSPVQLDRVIAEVLPLVRAAIPSTIEIRVDIQPVNRQVLGDVTQIHQILLNLCTNAYHAMQDIGGIIAIALTRVCLRNDDIKVRAQNLPAGEYLVLEVSDNGCGMDRKTLERIFDPYFTTKKKGDGTGLGLAVVNGIVKRFAGMISVYSEPGQGTTFRIFLPCGELGMTEDKPVSHELPLGHERIMVVDDEAVVGEVACETLESLGYRTALFVTCEDALQAFRKGPQEFDLVITDMTMPQLTGFELGSSLRDLRPDIPLILCTGFSDLINEQKALDGGFQRYLMKPIMMGELARAVREVLDVGQFGNRETT